MGAKKNEANKSAASIKRANKREQLRAKYRNAHGDNWHKNKSVKSAYDAEARKAGVLPADMFAALVDAGAMKSKGRGRGGRSRKNPLLLPELY